MDLAGEIGAHQIYEGQLAVLRGTEAGDKIQEMADQAREVVHANGMPIHASGAQAHADV